MEESIKPDTASSGAVPGVAGATLSPELVAALANVLGAALSKPTSDATVPGVPPMPEKTVGQADTVAMPLQAGERIGEALADAAGTLLVSTENKLKSRKLWVAIGAMAAMLVQLPLGVSLPPAAQLVIGAVAGIYLVMQGRVDHAQVKQLQGPGA